MFAYYLLSMWKAHSNPEPNFLNKESNTESFLHEGQNEWLQQSQLDFLASQIYVIKYKLKSREKKHTETKILL